MVKNVCITAVIASFFSSENVEIKGNFGTILIFMLNLFISQSIFLNSIFLLYLYQYIRLHDGFWGDTYNDTTSWQFIEMGDKIMNFLDLKNSKPELIISWIGGMRRLSVHKEVQDKLVLQLSNVCYSLFTTLCYLCYF